MSWVSWHQDPTVGTRPGALVQRKKTTATLYPLTAAPIEEAVDMPQLLGKWLFALVLGAMPTTHDSRDRWVMVLTPIGIGWITAFGLLEWRD